jgi:hypothetical protein
VSLLGLTREHISLWSLAWAPVSLCSLNYQQTGLSGLAYLRYSQRSLAK